MPKKSDYAAARSGKRPVIADWQKIGREFRLRRKRCKLSQSLVANWIGVSQRQLSLAEAGKAALTDEQIKTLDQEFEKLTKGVGLDALAFRPLNLLPENEFLSIQQTMLASWKYHNLWFFGIRHLPVLRDRPYRDAWASNLQGGTGYNLVMVLDKLMEESSFQLLQNTLSEISGRLEKDRKAHRKITVYGLVIREMDANAKESGALARTCQSYTRLKEHFDSFYGQTVEVKKYVDISHSDFDNCRAILHYGWLRSVVCYEGDRGQNSFAAVFLDHISNNPRSSEDGESGWTFLSSSATADLQTNIANFSTIMKGRL